MEGVFFDIIKPPSGMTATETKEQSRTAEEANG